MEEQNKTAAEAEQNQHPEIPAYATAAAPAKKQGLRFRDNPTRYITNIAMLSALAFVVMAVMRIPIPFAVVGSTTLKFEAKDAVTIIGGFIFGPAASVIISVVVSFIEMFTVSDTWFYGALMNIFSTLSFVLPAVIIYKRQRNFKGAVIGLLTGVVTVTILMLMWNWLITPAYLHSTSMPFMETKAIREIVVKNYLAPVFIPFNLIKYSLVSGIVMLIYKPLVNSLRKANVLPGSGMRAVDSSKKQTILTVAASLAIIAACIILFALLKNPNA